ncbi:AIPR family protein [Bifidobacterium parmae]|uniref:AIPR protein n=1 Tax=Bifidobacterium parmae TaxID=361854 RepID=A0A2N5J4T5_9BIFI|nr:AIPR family protein [Bifidobacterium parmae]PLS29221.1 AIPR protein [Bifidobacterium parmae]
MSGNLSNNQTLLKGYIEKSFNESEYSRKSDYFEFFAAENALKGDGVGIDDITSGLTGRGGDGGCDGLYLFCNSEIVHEDAIQAISNIGRSANLRVVILQAKNETSFNENVIMKWKTLSSNLLDFDKELSEFKGRYNASVLDFFAMFKTLRMNLMGKNVKIIFEYIYVSLGEDVHPNIISQEKELKEEVERYFPDSSVNVRHIGASELMTLVNASPSVKLILPLADTPISLGDRKNYIALVKLDEYYRFISDDSNNLRKSIFESNVRDYQGANNVNKAIKGSLCRVDGNDDFWWLNNGVTILAADVTQETQKKLLITDPEIVNGLQTSNEIYFFYSDNPEQLNHEQRHILVRVIVPEDESSRDCIILANNSQTTIPAVTLRATDPIQRNIEMCLKSHGLYYDRKKNYYRNQGRRPAEIVSISFLGQCLMSIFKSSPNTARARPSTLLNDDNQYHELYSNEIDIEVYWKCAAFGKRIERFVKNSSLPRGVQNDILFYVIYSAIANSCKKKDVSFSDFLSLDTDLIGDDSIQYEVDRVNAIYEKLGGNSTVAKGTNMIRNLKEQICSDSDE